MDLARRHGELLRELGHGAGGPEEPERQDDVERQGPLSLHSIF